MIKRLTSELHILPGIKADADAFDGIVGTAPLNLAKYRECVFVIDKGVGATGRSTITVESCDDTVHTTVTAVAFEYRLMATSDVWGAWTAVAAAGVLTTAGSNQQYEVRICAEGLSGTDKYVRLIMSETVDSPVDGAVIVVLSKAAFSGASAIV